MSISAGIYGPNILTGGGDISPSVFEVCGAPFGPLRAMVNCDVPFWEWTKGLGNRPTYRSTYLEVVALNCFDFASTHSDSFGGLFCGCVCSFGQVGFTSFIELGRLMVDETF